MAVVTCNLIGNAPLILHNGQLANPLNRYAKRLKEISGKRKKTDDDHAKMARIEFEGSLYLDTEKRPCVPSVNIQAAIVKGAMLEKCGPQAKSGVFVLGDSYPIKHPGPDDVEGLWDNGEGEAVLSSLVKVGQAKVVRTRPIFHKWRLDGVQIEVAEDVVSIPDLKRWAEAAGRVRALGDWRPTHGRFKVDWDCVCLETD